MKHSRAWGLGEGKKLFNKLVESSRLFQPNPKSKKFQVHWRLGEISTWPEIFSLKHFFFHHHLSHFPVFLLSCSSWRRNTNSLWFACSFLSSLVGTICLFTPICFIKLMLSCSIQVLYKEEKKKSFFFPHPVEQKRFFLRSALWTYT